MSTDFNSQMVQLIDAAQEAWNKIELDKFEILFEEDILITMEAVTVAGVHFEEQNIRGKEMAMHFMRKYRKKLPLRYQVEYDKKKLAKHMVYRKFFYQIKVWAHFDCTVSEYGKFKEFHISTYENVNSQKPTVFYLIKNLVLYKLKSLLGIKSRRNV